ncbi:protease family c26 gamma-glutamyl hydrolase [Anaeramoeba ignava]|uniref:folate gamma-glutamyl hydrolase n=1 Tax=Anaeramoeba ignava TaxID=1746090 RepID=A0A9Q0LHZ8_ANAIG|nr:protease family c26 gamma-glutamyl hydrolase [Anaeramoeba ignava]|eukprot:Anaeramoba_ignava/a225306_74.p1 GENE.a225306_74~~a225306_74.p1  ORF type:complete len:309 (+),score=54.26 a225306_74:32-958(+)
MNFSFIHLIFIFLFFHLIHSQDDKRPFIIGVFTQPTSSGDESFVPWSYINFIQASGGRALPIHFNASHEEILDIMKSIDGILFTGGSQDFFPFNSTWIEAAKLIYNNAIQLNDNNHPFLLWGTCMGFELLLCLTNNDPSTITNGFDSVNVNLELIFTQFARDSNLYSKVPDTLFYNLTRFNLTYNDHHWGITPDRFNSLSNLYDFYNILSTTKDINGRSFVSSIEAKKYPFFGVQFHPEAALSLFCDSENYPHSSDAKLFAYYLSEFINSNPRNSHDIDPSILFELQGSHLLWDGNIDCMFGDYYYQI